MVHTAVLVRHDESVEPIEVLLVVHHVHEVEVSAGVFVVVGKERTFALHVPIPARRSSSSP